MSLEQIRPNLEQYDIHKEWQPVRDMRLKVLAQMAVHEARRHGKHSFEYEGLEVEVELDDGEMLH